jgi:hypothetical protein
LSLVTNITNLQHCSEMGSHSDVAGHVFHILKVMSYGIGVWWLEKKEDCQWKTYSVELSYYLP